MINARHLALKILLTLNRTLYIQSALDIFLNKYNLNDKDKGLCTELVYGYLRNEIRIKYILNHFFKNTHSIPHEMFITLGLAVYSILFLTKIPDYASVNWAVEHTKNKFNIRLSKVSNAVLRNIIRQREEIKAISFYTAKGVNSEFDAYALFYSMPLWIANLWRDFFGDAKACILIEKFSHKPSVGIRLNYKHKDFEIIKSALLKTNGFLLNNYGIMFDSGQVPKEVNCINLKEYFNDGLCSYQSAGSILAVDAMVKFNCNDNITKDEVSHYHLGFNVQHKYAVQAQYIEHHKNADYLRYAEQEQCFVKSEYSAQINTQNYSFAYSLKEPIWDMCAGQGGKTCAFLERGYAVKLATDVNLNRLKLLEKNIIRLKLPMPAIVLVDKSHACITAWKGTILIDAPCSGLGILHRRPDIKRIKTYEDMQRYVLVQKELLNSAWSKLQINGIILYITCTINPLENQIQIRNFLYEHSKAALIGEWQSDANSFSCEGMYVASVQKKI